jgi:hypothetical protein
VRTHTITDREAFDRWQLEYQLVDGLLRRVEEAERAILGELGCPADPVGIDDILSGKRRAPWPKRADARQRHRARHAMHTLVHAATTRRYLALGEENSRLAAHAALLSGLHANDAAINAVIAMNRRNAQLKGLRLAPLAKHKKLEKRDKRIRKAAAKLNRKLSAKAKAERLHRQRAWRNVSVSRLRKIIATK